MREQLRSSLITQMGAALSFGPAATSDTMESQKTLQQPLNSPPTNTSGKGPATLYPSPEKLAWQFKQNGWPPASSATPVGRVLRKTCLDEPPQLWSALPQGDISLSWSRIVKKWILTAATLVVLGLAGTVGYAVYRIYFSHPGRFSSEVSTEGLKRTVKGNTLTSFEHPSARITLPPEYEYLGAHRFILYGTVGAEQYMFASSHPDGATRSLINVQFEAILPEIEGTYDYSAAPRVMRIGPLEFHVDADPVRRHWLVPNGLPGSDAERHYTAADERGFSVPRDYIWSRFAYVPEDAPRHEMLILQMEDLAPTGLTAPALRQGGTNAGDWEDLLDVHLLKLEQGITIEALE